MTMMNETIGITEIAKREAMSLERVRFLVGCGRLHSACGNRVTLASYERYVATGGYLEAPGARRRGIYFVQIGEFIKIGCSQDVLVRWRTPTDTPYEPIPLGFYPVDGNHGLYATEESLHRRFAAYRGRGEWFRDNAELRAFIAERAQPWPNERKEAM